MAEHDDWTAAEDARLRAALSSLRADVEATPLPDVRFVKARGMARRRRRFLAVGAAAAAAVVVAGTVGYAQLAGDPVLKPVPADRSGTTTAAPSPTTTSSLDQAGALPLLQEWKKALDLKGDARMTTQDPKSSDYRSFECLATVPSGQQLRQEITLDAGGFQGGQTQFAVSSGQDPVTVAEGLTNDISQCQQGPDFHVNRLDETDAGSLYSYTAGDAGSGWFAVVTGASDVTLIQVTDPTPGKSQYSLAQVTALAEIAKERLARYGTTVTPAPSTSGPQAIDEKMVVSGPDPVPSSNLFVAASQWASDALTGGAKTTAGPGALEGSTAVASCETDDQQAGIGGQVGVVSIRTGSGTASYIGRQRVQLDDATDATLQKAYVSARIAEAKALYAKGCDGANYTVQSTPGPTDGTFRLDTVFTDGSATLSEWVGVTSQRTPGAVSTVVITAAANPDQGFAELDRLLALARQKSAPAATTTKSASPPKTVTCAPINFTPASEDRASDIVASGVTCAVADPLVRANYKNYGAGTWGVDGWTCTAKKVQMQSGFTYRTFSCTKGSSTVTWRKS
ncbi:hypothetical protein [Phycicoccus sp. Soil803]|uniref:hypothetical protein n=1 Tax=Phycicoccus sp. Soil803 TaxID=1736415 RepID=UPI00070C8BE9|nr:hypothetical protein [Phycicoccus sp. Soil803]KRF24018.1 hypothetical protein ASG95_05130 [Phycicoccus sp. Soil803]